MSSLFYLLLCLSFHASSARLLGVIDTENGEGFHPFHKAVKEEKLHETSIPSSVKPSFPEVMRTKENSISKNDEKGVHESWGGAKKEKDTKVPEDTKVMGLAWNEIIALPFQGVLGEATRTEGWKGQSRRMMVYSSESTPNDADQEPVDSKEDEAVQDIVVMDYAKPHRKPPIHNREP